MNYIHPNLLTAHQKLTINNLRVDCSDSAKAISDKTGIHYTTIYRYIRGNFKKPEQSRADKGKSRRLTPPQIEIARKKFDEWFCANAQTNVSLTIYKVQKEIGIKIPRRLADKWAAQLTGTHKMNHYYKEFIATETYHHRRDLWEEIPSFMDLVVSDVWKIDDPYVPENERERINAELDKLKSNSPRQWQKARTKSATAYALVFMDVKTRYILNIEICPHSVTGADVKKGMLNVIMNWGDPVQWLLDNGKEFINNDTMDFLYGVHMGVMAEFIQTKVEKKILLKQDEKMINSRSHHPQGKGMIESFFKTLKNEWAAYSPSYSPNQFESRKPGLSLSSVQPIQSFDELALSLKNFIDTDYIERERSCFLDPGKLISHVVNQDRPSTVKEAFDRAYAVYNMRKVDEYLLAYYYADKRSGTFKNGCVQISDPISKLIFRYVPMDVAAISIYSRQQITCLIDPKDHAHCWIFKDDKLLCEASDLRYGKNAPLTKERAATLGKLQRAAIQLEKKKLDKIEEIEHFKTANKLNEAVERIPAERENRTVEENDYAINTIREDEPAEEIWDLLDVDDLTE